MSGTHLFYNGVLLRDCETREFSQTIQRDDSGTDVLYSRVRISVSSTLVSLTNIGEGSNVVETGSTHPSTIAIPRVDGETLVERWREVQTRMQEARKDFWYAINSTTKKPISQQTGYDPNGTDLPIPATDASSSDSYRVVLAATGLTEDDIKKLRADRNASIGKIKAFNPSGLTQSQFVDIDRAKVIDLDNGPTPISVNVEQVLGGRALRVSFTIEVCRCFCKPTADDFAPPAIDSAKAAGVISNRWGVSDSIDGDQSTHRTIRGKLVVSDRSWRPHALRLLVSPKLFPYAKLTDQRFAQDPKGLALEYEFSMKETGPAAPEGVTSWSGTYTESNTLGAGQTTGDVTVKVHGTVNPRNLTMQQQKTLLLAQAYNIVRSRVRFKLGWAALPGQDPTYVMCSRTVVIETMHKPEIELRMSFLYRDAANGQNQAIDGFGLRLKNMGADMSNSITGYDPMKWPVGRDFNLDQGQENEWSRTEGTGSYFDTYFQTPCSEWHGMPRRGEITSYQLDRTTNESLPLVTPNPSYFQRMDVYIDPDVTTTLSSQERPAPGTPIAMMQTGFSTDQSAFSYLQVELDNRYDLSSGNVMLPLSRPRYVSSAGGVQSAVIVPLHAGLAKRTITMVASRLGNWPQVPAPSASITTTGFRQTFLEGSIIPEAPQITKDGQGMIYKAQIRWVYGLSRLPQAGDRLQVGSSPIDRTKPADNALPIDGFFDYSGSIEVVQ